MVIANKLTKMILFICAKKGAYSNVEEGLDTKFEARVYLDNVFKLHIVPYYLESVRGDSLYKC